MSDQITVEVYCAESSHSKGKRAHIAQFYWSDDDRNPGWDQWPQGYLTPAGRAFRAGLQNDKPVVGDIAEGAPVRIRYHFACDLCGLSVVGRRERLSPILDGLAEAGVSEVSLRGLATILSKQH